MTKDKGTRTICFYLHGTNNSNIYKIESGREYILGRDESSEFLVRDENVSSKHLKIFIKGEYAFIQDLESSNGTLINSTPLTALREEVLCEGDTVEVGQLSFCFTSSEKREKTENNFEIISSSSYYESEFQNISEGFQLPIKDLIKSEERLLQKIKSLELLLKKEDALSAKLESFSQELGANGLERLNELELYHSKNEEKYETILADIPKLEAKLKLLKLTAKNMEQLLEERNSLKAIEVKYSKCALELKEMRREKGRENLNKLNRELKLVRENIKNAK